MDACDYMMEKANQPKGLIRIDSENAIAENKPNTFSTRSKAYTAVLVLLFAIIIYLFTLRGAMEATILRTPGTLFQTQPDGSISNLYNVKAVNKSNKDLKLTFEVMNVEGTIKMVGSDTLYLPKGEGSQQAFFVNIAKEKLQNRNTKIKIGIFSDGILLHENKTTFSGPEQ